MTVDLIDQAFLARLRVPVAIPGAGTPPPPPTAVSASPPAPDDSVAAPPDDPVMTAPIERLETAPHDPVVTALLESCSEQWERLAGHVESAWAAGERVVAVAGRAHGDGVSTVVRGLAHVLRRRGGRVTCRGADAARGGREIGGDTDGPVVVDGGVWFPPGPVHRGRLARAAFGCHAAILVRRAGRSPCAAHAAALAALGIRVLGEVITFADCETHPVRMPA